MLLLSAISVLVLVTGSPVQVPWEGTSDAGGKKKAMEALLETYAPVIKLSALEAFLPSSVDYMLPHYAFIEDGDSGEISENTTLLYTETLDQLPRAGQGKLLSIKEDHNPQPFLDRNAEYLYGPEAKHTGDGRGKVETPIYAFWVDGKRGVVDLWYWTFYPFNLGKPVGPFGLLGNHVGDWEHLRVRTINGTAVSADYHSHNGGAFSAGTVRWSDVPKIDERPVAYSAAGSHGLWPAPGDHVFAHVLNFRLVDITDDDGAVWDTKGHVVPAQYWYGPESRRKVWHNETRSWLNFRGTWGNKGENDCWWFKLVGICQLVDAPPGPNRWFGHPPDCVTAPISWETSTYSFYLSSSAVKWAEDRQISTVQVDQICARPRKKDDDTDDDDEVDYVHDMMRDGDLETWKISGMAPFARHDRHEVMVLPCKGLSSAVKSYRVSLCLTNGKCVSTSQERKVCTYQEGRKGYRFGNAARVEDVDDWFWNL